MLDAKVEFDDDELDKPARREGCVNMEEDAESVDPRAAKPGDGIPASRFLATTNATKSSSVFVVVGGGGGGCSGAVVLFVLELLLAAAPTPETESSKERTEFSPAPAARFPIISYVN